MGVRDDRLASWRASLREVEKYWCKLCGRRLRIYEDLGQGGYCGYCAPWDYGERGELVTEEGGKTMADVWRVTVDDEVQESTSFTPLEAIIKKLINRRKPFKVGFGKLIETKTEGVGATGVPRE